MSINALVLGKTKKNFFVNVKNDVSCNCEENRFFSMPCQHGYTKQGHFIFTFFFICHTTSPSIHHYL